MAASGDSASISRTCWMRAAAARGTARVQRLPGDLATAIAALPADTVLGAALGSDLVRSYSGALANTWRRYQAFVTDWELPSTWRRCETASRGLGTDGRRRKPAPRRCIMGV
jgi:hypothetical protein